jgi:hypothetical protein
MDNGRLAVIRWCAGHQGVSSTASDVMQNAISSSTSRHYDAPWRAWLSFCQRLGIHALAAAGSDVVNFIASLVKKRSGASPELAASVVSATLRACGRGLDEVDSYRLARVIQAFRRDNVKPSRAAAVCDPLTIIRYVASWGTTSKLSSSQLRARALVLLRVDSMCRPGEPSNLTVADVCVFSKDRMTIRFLDTKEQAIHRRVKSRASLPAPTISVMAFNAKPSMCAVRAMEAWLNWRRRQQGALSSSDYVFTSLRHPFSRLSSDRVSNIVAETMLNAGIPRGLQSRDVRGSSASKALAAGASWASVLAQGRWAPNSTTFLRHYHASGLFRVAARAKLPVSASLTKRLRSASVYLAAVKGYNNYEQ